MLAYKIAEVGGEERAVIAYAVRNAPARRIGAGELDLEWSEVSCRRAPEFDKYAAQGGPTPLQYIEEGWWAECMHCRRRVSDDRAWNLHEQHSEAAPGVTLEPLMEPQEHEGDLYCNAACWAAEQEERAAFARRLEEARTTTLQRWPGVTVTRVLGNNGTQPPHVLFQLPGVEGPDGSFGWTVGDETLTCSDAARAHWAAYEAGLA